MDTSIMTKFENYLLIVDEGVSSNSPIWKEFQKAHKGQEWHFTHLREAHPGIPDVEILDKLLVDSNTALLTSVRVLHMQALARGYRSFTLTEIGYLTHEALPGVHLPARPPQSVLQRLEPAYMHRSVTTIPSLLKRSLTERQLKRYRTARRRIRSYFGSAAAISKVSITIGMNPAASQGLCGFFMHIEGTSGVKGLHATEGYFHGPKGDLYGAASVVYALHELYLLQLEGKSTNLFIMEPAAYELSTKLVTISSKPGMNLHGVLQILLQNVTRVNLQLCRKGRCHDRMICKFDSLIQSVSNEVVVVNFDKIIENLSDFGLSN